MIKINIYAHKCVLIARKQLYRFFVHEALVALDEHIHICFIGAKWTAWVYTHICLKHEVNATDYFVHGALA